jgi:hypothetical protein
VSDLYQRLVAAGMLPATKAETHEKKQEEAKSVMPVDFKQPETLKV